MKQAHNLRRFKAKSLPCGRVVLVEYRGEDSSIAIKRLHKMTQLQAKKEMSAVGLNWLHTDDYLPQQHVMIFIKQ